MLVFQQTLKKAISFEGTGLHSGESCKIRVEPAPTDHGIVFAFREGDREIRCPARVESICDTMLATTLSPGGDFGHIRIATTEHLMAALWGAGIDNALIQIEGPEVPSVDGSALPFMQGLLDSGRQTQTSMRRYLVIKESVEVSDGDRSVRLEPARSFRVSCRIQHEHSMIPLDTFTYEGSEEHFLTELAPARTFGFTKDLEAMQKLGLARGGSLDNALVFDQNKLLNPEGLRFDNECVRHKMLDSLGDLFLCGHRILGHLILDCPGHALNAQLARKLLDTPTSYSLESIEISPQAARHQGEPALSAHP